jgi:hypothetical protein
MSPPPADPKNCENCKWWTRDADDPAFGQCHRYAPMPRVGCAFYDHQQATSLYPRTPTTEWCGDWVKV